MKATKSFAKRKREKRAAETTIGAAAERLLKVKSPRPLDYATVVAEIKKLFPDSHVSEDSVRWYASRLKASGERLPVRPRKVRGG